MFINKEDILPFNFFTYGKPFFGSVNGMRYCITRSTATVEDPEAEGGTKEVKILLATVWRGPLAFEATQEEKISKEFSFSASGRDECIEWLEANYSEKPEFWELGTTLYPPRKQGH